MNSFWRHFNHDIIHHVPIIRLFICILLFPLWSCFQNIFRKYCHLFLQRPTSYTISQSITLEIDVLFYNTPDVIETSIPERYQKDLGTALNLRWCATPTSPDFSRHLSHAFRSASEESLNCSLKFYAKDQSIPPTSLFHHAPRSRVYSDSVPRLQRGISS